MILHIKETDIRARKKHFDESIRIYHLKFTFKGPQYIRNIYFFDDSLAVLPKY